MSEVAIGVDVGGTKVLAVLLDRRGVVLDSERVLTPHVAERPAGDAAAEVVHDLVKSVASRNNLSSADVVVGVGLPGMMSRDGVLVFAPNLPSASGANLAASLRALDPNVRVLCENDADCAAVAEYQLGAGRGCDDMVMVTLGTGIGGGIISHGELLRGRHGFAGEIGHMVVDARGPRCPCGSRGCWERFASGAGVARLAREAATAGRLPVLVSQCGGSELVRSEDITLAAAAGLGEALDVIDEVGWWLALGLANLAAILDCSHFVIGGGLSEASTLLLPAAQRHIASLVEGGPLRPPITVVASHFNERSGAIGAALLAFERLAP
ncbi:MAG: ROK family protein [Actinomycetota bacterium]